MSIFSDLLGEVNAVADIKKEESRELRKPGIGDSSGQNKAGQNGIFAYSRLLQCMANVRYKTVKPAAPQWRSGHRGTPNGQRKGANSGLLETPSTPRAQCRLVRAG